MPLGDPCGRDFEYTTEGLPTSVAFVEVPVSDMETALHFYHDTLKMTAISQNDNVSVLELKDGGRITLIRRPNAVGKDTGIFLKVDDPFVFNRRMVDDGVVITRHPQKGYPGTYASFRDTDGNIIHVIGRS